MHFETFSSPKYKREVIFILFVEFLLVSSSLFGVWGGWDWKGDCYILHLAWYENKTVASTCFLKTIIMLLPGVGDARAKVVSDFKVKIN